MTLPILTASEKRILTLTMFGFNGPQVATMLGIQPQSVKNQFLILSKKLHTKTKVHTVMMAIALGYINTPLLPQLTEIKK